MGTFGQKLRPCGAIWESPDDPFRVLKLAILFLDLIPSCNLYERNTFRGTQKTQ